MLQEEGKTENTDRDPPDSAKERSDIATIDGPDLDLLRPVGDVALEQYR